jgi:hypothetical protein
VVNGHLGTWRELYVVIRGKALWMRARGSKDGESRYELWYMCMVLSWNWYVVDLELQILAWDGGGRDHRRKRHGLWSRV